MRITTRRVSVIFSHTFTDVDGEPTTPDSATLTLEYPGEGWPFDGMDQLKTTIDLTSDDGLTWGGTWVSTISSPGLITWFAEATTDDVLSGQDMGYFKLRGNGANLTFINA